MSSTEPKTLCPNCKQECEEQFFAPEKLGPEWTLSIADDGHVVASKSTENGFTVNPYPNGGTFLICKNCVFYTFYPREEMEIEL